MQILDKSGTQITHYPYGRDIPYTVRTPQNATIPTQKTVLENDIKAITCFTPHTAIATINGLISVQHLQPGDRVLTRDRGFQPIRWIGTRHLSNAVVTKTSETLPVLIRANALAPGKPERDIVVSPRHRVLTTDKDLLSALGETEALIEARTLIGRPGVSRIAPDGLSYFHLLFDQHEIILSDNIWSESFHLSAPTIAALLEDNQHKIREIFPQIQDKPERSPHVLARLCLAHEDVSHALHDDHPATSGFYPKATAANIHVSHGKPMQA